MELFESLKQKIIDKNLKLVFPEGQDERILAAVVRLVKDGLIKAVVLGQKQEITATANKLNVMLPTELTVLDPAEYPAVQKQEMIDALVKLRNGKTDEATAKKWLEDVNYFGTMLVYMKKVDGLVSGACHPTGDTVRPALQIVKTKPNVSRTSGAFVMVHPQSGEKYLFADCAININPNAQELAEIAVESAKTARIFGIDPKIAMLSFSTKGSAKSAEVDKVVAAKKIAQQLAPSEAIDGELQFDAAFVPSVGASKAPNSPVAGKANVFVFPELEAGNIGYKMVQRFGGLEAIGPILQGLNRPISDLSRGCSEEDVYKVALITAAQALSD